MRQLKPRRPRRRVRLSNSYRVYLLNLYSQRKFDWSDMWSRRLVRNDRKHRSEDAGDTKLWSCHATPGSH